MKGYKSDLRTIAIAVFVALAFFIRAVFQKPFAYDIAGGSMLRTAPTKTDTDHAAKNLLDFWWVQSLKDTSVSLDSSTRQMIFPKTANRIWVDVGVHKETDFMPNLKQEPDLFVLGFEPSSLWKPCPHTQCVVFWAACTPDYDIVHLNLQTAGNMCNSLLKPDSNTTSPVYPGCVTQQTNADGQPKTMQVPGMPLHALIDKIPPHLSIEYIKIDAQGFDLQVMQGALPASGRIQVVSLEAMDVDDKTKLLYKGQPTLSEIKETLQDAGWQYVQSLNNKGVAGEVNAFFVSDPQYLPKVQGLAENLAQTLL